MKDIIIEFTVIVSRTIPCWRIEQKVSTWQEVTMQIQDCEAQEKDSEESSLQDRT